MGLVKGVLTPQVWRNINRNKKTGVEGNLKGEGRLLGGVLVVGKNDQGVLMDAREEVWGTHADVDAVRDACLKIEGKKEEAKSSSSL
mmetsp:Transcript_25823/g.45857  ORF Transcript_25823/g.45857 Transcript_25823/m.45857 type:complete len:87 (+) Transcript_25823:499-759(+)